MPCQVHQVEFVCASQDSTGGKACSGNRRLQRGIHAQTNDRRRAHLHGTTTRMNSLRRPCLLFPNFLVEIPTETWIQEIRVHTDSCTSHRDQREEFGASRRSPLHRWPDPSGQSGHSTGTMAHHEGHGGDRARNNRDFFFGHECGEHQQVSDRCRRKCIFEELGIEW